MIATTTTTINVKKKCVYLKRARVKFCAKPNELNSVPMRSHSASNALALAYKKTDYWVPCLSANE